MSVLNIRRILQRVVAGTNQPLTLGGIQTDGSDARITIPTSGDVLVDGKKMVNSLLAEYEVTGSAVSSVDFTGLDINTHKSYRVEVEIMNSAVSDAFLYLFANNDTTQTNYYNQLLYGNGSSAAASRSNNAVVLYTPASGSSMNTITVQKSFAGYVRAHVLGSQSSPSGIIAHTYAWVKTNIVTNITQLTFTASVANSIGIGSKVRIYRGDV